MKKDVEWVREQIKNEMNSWGGGNPDYFRGAEDAYENVKDWLNQLDEPEVLSQKWINEHKREYDEYPSGAPVLLVDDVKSLLVPKQEEITEEQAMYWLDNNEFYDHVTAETVLEKAVDKGELSYYGTKYLVIEKPSIPQVVANWIEECKGWDDDKQDYDDDNATGLFNAMDLDNAGMSNEVHDYLADNTETFARAWLEGYKLAKEPKYYIEIPATNNYLTLEDGELYFSEKLKWFGEKPNIEQCFTEKEIKALDKGDVLFEHFAVKVEELEE